jgi:hypothetical protein
MGSAASRRSGKDCAARTHFFGSRGTGSSSIYGWLTAFVWYVDGEPKGAARADWSQHGIDHSQLPLHVSKVPFLWEYLGETLDMQLVGGVLAVDDDEGFLSPGLSYAVVHAARGAGWARRV